MQEKRDVVGSREGCRSRRAEWLAFDPETPGRLVDIDDQPKHGDAEPFSNFHGRTAFVRPTRIALAPMSLG